MEMSLTAVEPKPRKSKQRSAISNATAMFLDGVDGRSALARRYKDLVEDLRGHLGSPTAPQEIVLRRAATLAAWAEAQEAAHLAGEKALDVAIYLPLVNGLRRLCNDLGLTAVARDITPSLSTYLADKVMSEEQDIKTADDAGAGLAVERPVSAEDGPGAAPVVGAPAVDLPPTAGSPPHGLPGPSNPIPVPQSGGGDLMTDRPRPLSIGPEAEPVSEPRPAVEGDEVDIEGRCILRCTDIRDGREIWWLLRPGAPGCAATALEPCFGGRERAEARARKLIETGHL